MAKVHNPDEAYAGRRLDAVVVNLTLDQGAADILRRDCTRGRKTMGHFVSRLLYEYEARRQERQNIIGMLAQESSGSHNS